MPLIITMPGPQLRKGMSLANGYDHVPFQMANFATSTTGRRPEARWYRVHVHADTFASTST